MIRFDTDELKSSSSSQNRSKNKSSEQGSKNNASSALMKLTRKITTMDSFLQEHTNTNQAYQIVNSITAHLERIEKPKTDKKRYYKSLLMTKGNILGALLNQTIMKLLSAVKQIRELDGMDTKTWLDGEWVTVPQQIYDFFNYLTYEMGTLMGVLEPK